MEMATSAPLIDSVPKKVVQILIYKYFNLLNQCCGSKFNEFGSGSRIFVQFGSGSRVM